MRAKQMSFLPRLSVEHGGALGRGRRKIARPIDPKAAVHVVLRSSLAKGHLSLLHPRHCEHVERYARQIAARNGVRLYRFTNVGNHLHLLVKTPTRKAFQKFLREVAGAIAMIVTGARKGAGLRRNETGRGFWDQLAYTRIVRWGRDFRNLELYFIKNLFEAEGLLTRRMKAAGVQVIPLVGWTGPP